MNETQMNDSAPGMSTNQVDLQHDPYAMHKPDPEVELLMWQAPNRPFKKRNREFFTTVFLIVFLVSLILFFANQFLPIAVVLALGFLTYVLASVPPEMIENKITTYGVYSDKNMAYWYEMGRYWFTRKYKTYILHIETARFPFRMMLLFTPQEKEQLEKVMDKYLIKEAPAPTAFDKAADWLQEKIPLDREEQNKKVQQKSPNPAVPRENKAPMNQSAKPDSKPLSNDNPHLTL